MHVVHSDLALFLFKRLNPTCITRLNFYHTILCLTTLTSKAFENIVGKGENDGKQHFVPFSQYSITCI